MNYPDVKAIVSGYYEPKDEARCLVCGKELRGCESTCGRRCFRKMCEIQRQFTAEDVDRMLKVDGLISDEQRRQGFGG
jgi:hypothetical protein